MLQASGVTESGTSLNEWGFSALRRLTNDYDKYDECVVGEREYVRRYLERGPASSPTHWSGFK